jgi:hypothetical protein
MSLHHHTLFACCVLTITVTLLITLANPSLAMTRTRRHLKVDAHGRYSAVRIVVPHDDVGVDAGEDPSRILDLIRVSSPYEIIVSREREFER